MVLAQRNHAYSHLPLAFENLSNRRSRQFRSSLFIAIPSRFWSRSSCMMRPGQWEILNVFVECFPVSPGRGIALQRFYSLEKILLLRPDQLAAIRGRPPCARTMAQPPTAVKALLSQRGGGAARISTEHYCAAYLAHLGQVALTEQGAVSLRRKKQKREILGKQRHAEFVLCASSLADPTGCGCQLQRLAGGLHQHHSAQPFRSESRPRTNRENARICQGLQQIAQK